MTDFLNTSTAHVKDNQIWMSPDGERFTVETVAKFGVRFIGLAKPVLASTLNAKWTRVE